MGAFELCAECVHTAQTRPISEMLSDLGGPVSHKLHLKC